MPPSRTGSSPLQRCSHRPRAVRERRHSSGLLGGHRRSASCRDVFRSSVYLAFVVADDRSTPAASGCSGEFEGFHGARGEAVGAPV